MLRTQLSSSTRTRVSATPSRSLFLDSDYLISYGYVLETASRSFACSSSSLSPSSFSIHPIPSSSKPDLDPDPNPAVIRCDVPRMKGGGTQEGRGREKRVNRTSAPTVSVVLVVLDEEEAKEEEKEDSEKRLQADRMTAKWMRKTRRTDSATLLGEKGRGGGGRNDDRDVSANERARSLNPNPNFPETKEARVSDPEVGPERRRIAEEVGSRSETKRGRGQKTKRRAWKRRESIRTPLPLCARCRMELLYGTRAYAPTCHLSRSDVTFWCAAQILRRRRTWRRIGS
mmetsp:Transcript_32498/g.59011  ORF Transcript_32498/g.59011 Transcript_32498/m.59011 type:complete len:286 (+) Transcript_32498:582-1439(+)